MSTKGEIMNARKKQIMDVAHRLFIEKGFQATSIQDILDNASIAKGTFYNHFASKNECLMAILDHVRYETQKMRKELTLGKQKNDIEVFIQQILVRMKMNKEQNMLVLYESVFYSKDQDLKAYMRKQHTIEMNWAADRIVDLYGQDIKPYSLDRASILFGIIHHIMHVWMLGSKREYDLEDIIRYSINCLSAVNQQQQIGQEPFFPANWLLLPDEKVSKSQKQLIETIRDRLTIFISHLKKQKSHQRKIEHIDFLLSEFSSKVPRDSLIQSIVHSLPAVFTASVYHEEINDIVYLIQQYLDYK